MTSGNQLKSSHHLVVQDRVRKFKKDESNFDQQTDGVIGENEFDHVIHFDKKAIGEFDCNSIPVYEDTPYRDTLPTLTTCSHRESSSSLSSSCDEGHESDLNRCRSILKTSTSGSRCDNLKTSFSTLEIREYYITLGDNPGGCEGPPLTLDWEYNEDRTKILELDDYETKRKPRRGRWALLIPNNVRMWMLLREKRFTIKQLRQAGNQAQLIRTQRRRSAGFYGLYKKYHFVMDTFQKISRKIR